MMEKISWTERVKKEEVLHRVKEERNILRTIKRRKANWIGHIWRRNCFLKCVNEEEEDVSSYRMTLRKSEDNGNCKRKH
jgi:hypothetical protein